MPHASVNAVLQESTSLHVKRAVESQAHRVQRSNIPELLCHNNTNRSEAQNDPDNTEPPPQSVRVFAGNVDIHAKETGNQIERHQNRGEDGNLPKQSVGSPALFNVAQADLRQVVGVAATQHLFEMRQVRHHRDHVVLHVAQVPVSYTHLTLPTKRIV